ncbi:hypothetical protein PHYSODRAFT_339913 [Phytophthora sojae]|uniref:Uncharacterized protein n=1 Tax=Phytophthora sojae (strain P6497) TaxID=1094619 RepID=G5A814_PHYSP|nr:hypothetical protein PHYSODRAFT_339913 [Phytophthora sojae]EGZ08040.1 hypothetical protein PHYSODRAFT_339913 [Phytophthora sojae]|eukprot:XP_009536212.1 hypothetical protein PHYSODRAFT_339913 [Phytophthora sojae]
MRGSHVGMASSLLIPQRTTQFSILIMWSFLSVTSPTRIHHTPEFPLQQRIRDELVHSTTTHKVPTDPQQQKFNVFTCVEAAVHCGMPRVVLAMYRFNPADVRLATWYALYRLKTKQAQAKVSPELVALARAQRRAWLWDRIGVLVLQKRSCSSK